MTGTMKSLTAGVLAVAALGVGLGLAMGQAAAEKPVVTVYKSPT